MLMLAQTIWKDNQKLGTAVASEEGAGVGGDYWNCKSLIPCSQLLLVVTAARGVDLEPDGRVWRAASPVLLDCSALW